MDYDLRKCRGRLTRGKDSLDTTFDLFVDRFGEVSIHFGEMPLNSETGFLFGLMNDGIADGDLPTLVGKHSDGTEIKARYLQVVEHNMRGDKTGSSMSFRMQTLDLHLTMEAESDKGRTTDRLEYIFPRLKCFCVGDVTTSDGCFSVMGETDIGDHNELGGFVMVELPVGRTAVLEEYDARVETLLDYLSLANGRLLRWSVRKYFVPGGQVSIRFRGRQAKAGKGLPLFPYLHLRPAIEAALTNITVEEHRRLGLHVAIGWTLLNSQFTEANFQGMMTALEHLVHVGLPSEDRGTVFPRAEFKSIQDELRRSVEAALEACGYARDDSRVAEFAGRIGGLNNRSLRSRVKAYLDAHRVPAKELESEIPAIFHLRNQVVHRGLADDYEDEAFYDQVDAARELLSRIFMTHLRYKGPYESYRGGNSVQQFGL